jgi:hypothetical protein
VPLAAMVNWLPTAISMPTLDMRAMSYGRFDLADKRRGLLKVCALMEHGRKIINPTKPQVISVLYMGA